MNEAKFNNLSQTISYPFFTENILIASGSRPRYLPNIPIDEKIIMTSDGVKNMTELPKSLVVLGAGVIGLLILQYLHLQKVKYDRLYQLNLL